MNLSVSSFAAGVLATLVVASGGAYAATGGNFILGKANSAGATTTLTNSNGTALALNAKTGTPALKVNTPVRVPNLNADKLDGLDSTGLARAGMKTGVVSEAAVPLDMDDNHIVDAFIVEVQCPIGTVLTGGGVNDATYTGRINYSGPTSDGQWWQVSVQTDNVTDESASVVEAYALCLNPKGAFVPAP